MLKKSHKQVQTIKKRYVWKFACSILYRFRLITAKARALPDFVIIGGQKCGTSSLYAYTQHPQILKAAKKEVHFFDVQFQKGTRWYRSNFPLLIGMYCNKKLISKDVITGEASPSYLFHPHAPRRLAESVPKAKLIALLGRHLRGKIPYVIIGKLTNRTFLLVDIESHMGSMA